MKVRGLTKSFEGNVVLDGVDFDLMTGEVHVLFGRRRKHNATKILCGGYLPNSGEIAIEGQKVQIAKPADSRSLGSCCSPQDFSLVPQLTVIENLYLGRELKTGLFLIKRDRAKKPKNYFENLNIDINIDLYEKISNLSMEKQQVVAIARALLQPLKVLILDEPTSSFTVAKPEFFLSTFDN